MAQNRNSLCSDSSCMHACMCICVCDLLSNYTDQLQAALISGYSRYRCGVLTSSLIRLYKYICGLPAIELCRGDCQLLSFVEVTECSVRTSYYIMCFLTIKHTTNDTAMYRTLHTPSTMSALSKNDIISLSLWYNTGICS